MFTSRKIAREFAIHHDEMPAFHAAYLVLTFLAALLLNFGVFALLVVIHMTLDFVKYREHHKASLALTFEGIFRENLLDLTVFAVGLCAHVYLHESLPIFAGAEGLARAEFTILRLGIEVTAKVKILHNLLNVISHVHQYLENMHPRLGKDFSALEGLSIILFFVSLVLLLLSPVLLPIDGFWLKDTLLKELVPNIT